MPFKTTFMGPYFKLGRHACTLVRGISVSSSYRPALADFTALKNLVKSNSKIL